MKNYYEILGVDENATQDDIKKAYRKLSKQYHPDVNPDGEEKFKDIAEAYDIIGDPEKRQDYENKKNNPFAGMGGHGFDIHSMFEQMMGGQMRGPVEKKKFVILVMGMDMLSKVLVPACSNNKYKCLVMFVMVLVAL